MADNKIVSEELLQKHVDGSVLSAEEKAAQSVLRQYTDATAERVRKNYRDARSQQTVEHVKRLREKFGAVSKPLTVWEAMAMLDTFVDLSDPDVEFPNLIHLFQSAEGMREQNLPDWMQLTAFIHDLGKMMYFKGADEEGTTIATQWSIVGDTFIVGCKIPDVLVFSEFNTLNPDMQDPRYNTDDGMYAPHCGLDNCLVSYGHDEYLYQVLTKNEGVKLPAEALYAIRYHSLYPWHDKHAYANLENDYDREMLKWVKLLNRHDLYSKKNPNYSPEKMAEMREYYDGLIKKYLPEVLLW